MRFDKNAAFVTNTVSSPDKNFLAGGTATSARLHSRGVNENDIFETAIPEKLLGKEFTTVDNVAVTAPLLKAVPGHAPTGQFPAISRSRFLQ